MQLIEEQILRITEDVWKSVLGMGITKVRSIPDSYGKKVASFVQIMGSWDGLVVLESTGELSRIIASKMFAMPLEEVTEEEILDALGELVNITGGNLKSSLPESCHLSLPAAIEGWDYTLRFPGSQLVSQVSFQCGEDHFFGVNLLKQGESQPFSKVVRSA